MNIIKPKKKNPAKISIIDYIFLATLALMLGFTLMQTFQIAALDREIAELQAQIEGQAFHQIMKIKGAD